MNLFKFTLGFALASSVFVACDNSAASDDKCTVQTIAVDCDRATIYNKMLELNETINNTFEKGAASLTLEEELHLREAFVSHYQKHEKVLLALHSELKDSLTTSFPPKQIFEMRSGEVDHFKKKMVKREKTKALIEALDISTYERDTILPGYEAPKRYLVMQINNTSDKTLTGLAIDKNYKVGGKVQKAETTTYYMLLPDQISPEPEGEAVVAPGSKLTLTFKTSEKSKVAPEIVEISTANQG